MAYLRSKYGTAGLRSYRLKESLYKKLEKARLDLEYLEICRVNAVIPNFIYFKLYRKSLHTNQLYSYKDMLSLYKKLEKARSDLEYLLEICLMICRKLYRKSLHTSQLYKDMLDSLFKNEINYKLNKVSSLKSSKEQTESTLRGMVTFLTFINVKIINSY